MYDVPRTHSQLATEQPAGLSALNWSKRPAVPPLPWSSPVMMTTAFLPFGKYQKRGSGFLLSFMCEDQVREQALLLVGLRNRDLVRGRPSPAATSPVFVAVELVVGPDRRKTVALLRRPGRVALARVDDRRRQVVGERRRLAAADMLRSVTAGLPVAVIALL